MNKDFDKLKKWSDAYYNGIPLVSDEKYDALYDKLKSEYPTNPFFKKVGAKTKAESVTLPYQMGSMNKLNPYNIMDWLDTNGHYLVSPKFDGLTCQLIYENGVLKAAYTRGDGYKGQPILNRALHLGGIPHKLPTSRKGKIEVEGEIVIYKSIFKKYYEGEYAHPRNFCVGTLRPSVTEKEYKKLVEDESTGIKERLNRMQYIAFKVRGLPETSKYDTLLTLKGWGFSTSIQPSKKWNGENFSKHRSGVKNCKCKEVKLPFKCLPNTKDLNTEWFKKAIDGVKSNKFDIACDGIIIEYEDLKKQDKMGTETNSLNPKWARAVKHIQSEQTGKITTVEDIEWNISKRGNFVPTLIVKPINLEGSVVSRVTGNNYKQVVDQKTGIGSKIKIVRSGDVIPYIVGIEKTANVKVFKKCPHCGATLEIKGVHLHCPNKKCSGRIMGEIQGFFQIAKCDFVSNATITDFVDAGYSLKKILTLKPSDITCLDGYKQTSANKICNSIKEMRGRMFIANIMHALGMFSSAISGLGTTKLQAIVDFLGAKKILDNKVPQSKLNRLSEVEGIASGSAELFTANYDAFQTKFQKIKDLFDFQDFVEVELASNKLEGMSFCWTGYRSKEQEQLVLDNGGSVKSSVTKDLTVLFSAGDSSKTKTAQSRGIKIISQGKAEEYLKKLIK